MNDTDLLEETSRPALRSDDDRYLAGLLGGLGRRFDLDAGLLRIAAVAVAVALGDDGGPVVPALYALGWVATASAADTAPIRRLRTPAGRREVISAGVVGLLGALLLVERSLWPAGALALAAWFLLSDRAETDERAAGETSPDADPSGWAESGEERGDDTFAEPTVATETAARWGRARRGAARPLPALRLPEFRRRVRSRREPALWPLTLALLVGFTIAFLALDQASDPGLAPWIWVNGSLAVVGGVLVLSAWRGRAGWTTVLAAPLLALWVAFSATGTPRLPGDGATTLGIVDNTQAVWRVEHGYGSQDIYVTAEALDPEVPVRIDAEMTAGELDIWIPADADLVLRSTVGLGTTTIAAEDEWSDRFQAGGTTWSVSRAADAPWCETWSWSASELERTWRDDRAWRDGDTTSAVAVGVPEFSDPGVFTSPSDELLDFVLLTLGAPAMPTPTASVDGVVTEWATSFSPSTGDTCDPAAEFTSLGTIEIDATIGLGGIHVHRQS